MWRGTNAFVFFVLSEEVGSESSWRVQHKYLINENICQKKFDKQLQYDNLN